MSELTRKLAYIAVYRRAKELACIANRPSKLIPVEFPSIPTGFLSSQAEILIGLVSRDRSLPISSQGLGV
jgi:hypothetical protein